MELHPQFIVKEGDKEFVLLPIAEYQALTELLHDYEDLRDLREAKQEARDADSVPLDKVISELDL